MENSYTLLSEKLKNEIAVQEGEGITIDKSLKLHLSSKKSLKIGSEILKNAILELDHGVHQWPSSDEIKTRIYYTILMEPIHKNYFEPFWALSSRFYYLFDVKWSTIPGGWFEYKIFQRKDGDWVGDPDFPDCKDQHCVVAGFNDFKYPINSYQPGELIVQFNSSVDLGTAKSVVKSQLPNSKIIEVIWTTLRILHISCTAFEELKEIDILESVSEVKLVDINSHLTLFPPGGYWAISQL